MIHVGDCLKVMRTLTENSVDPLLRPMRSAHLPQVRHESSGRRLQRALHREETAMTVTRFTPLCQFTDDGSPEAFMFAAPEGKFVLHSDYVAAMQAQQGAAPPDFADWPQWVKVAVRNANEAGRAAGRSDAATGAPR